MLCLAVKPGHLSPDIAQTVQCGLPEGSLFRHFFRNIGKGSLAADKGQFFALAERWFRPADQLDFMIRRWLIHRLIATDSSLRATLGRSPKARESDSTWRTKEVRHVGSDTVTP